MIEVPEAKLTGIPIEAFNPLSGERGSGNNLHIGRLLGEFTGRGRLNLIKRLRSGEVLSNVEASRLDRHVFNAMKDIYNLPDNTDMRGFYMQHQINALAVPGRLAEALPQIESWELKDEITMLSDRPSDLFRYLSRPPEKIDPTLEYEAHRHALLLHISFMLNARTLNGRLRTRLSDVHHTLNRDFFAGIEGSGERVDRESVHDDETNAFIGFPGDFKNIPPTAHIKRVPFTARTLTEGGHVYTSPRKKDDRTAVVKAILKGREKGIISTDTDVLDPIGMIMVDLDNRYDPKELAERAGEILSNDDSLDIDEIEDDNETGTDHGQSKGVNFNARKKIWFAGVPVPLELIFYNYQTYIDSRLKVGEIDKETGLPDGRAHSLFVDRREYQLAPIIFPESAYPGTGRSSARAFINRSKVTAARLREMYKVE